MVDSLLGSLVGEELSGVGFVRDYIELYFDGPVLRLLGQVSYLASDGPPSSLESSLVTLIGSRVTDVAEAINTIGIQFDRQTWVHLNGEHKAAEYAHLVTFPDKRLVVWSAE